jgi:hypothetical protein
MTTDLEKAKRVSKFALCRLELKMRKMYSKTLWCVELHAYLIFAFFVLLIFGVME